MDYINYIVLYIMLLHSNSHVLSNNEINQSRKRLFKFREKNKPSSVESKSLGLPASTSNTFNSFVELLETGETLLEVQASNLTQISNNINIGKLNRDIERPFLNDGDKVLAIIKKLSFALQKLNFKQLTLPDVETLQKYKEQYEDLYSLIENDVDRIKTTGYADRRFFTQAQEHMLGITLDNDFHLWKKNIEDFIKQLDSSLIIYRSGGIPSGKADVILGGFMEHRVHHYQPKRHM